MSSEVKNGGDHEQNSIIRKCSGPETAFNNISNNGGATIGCVMQVNLGRPITCADFMSLFELLYQKYQILRLQFILKNKCLFWREASREETFNVIQLEELHDKKKFTEEFLCDELCALYPYGSQLWCIRFGPLAESSSEISMQAYSSFLISFRCNHGFLDGVGAMSLFQDFGHIISEYISTHKLPVIEPIGLSAPYEDLVPEAKFVWVLRQCASVGIRFVETFTSFKKSLPNYYPVQNMLRLDKFKPRTWTSEKDKSEVSGVAYQYFVMDERHLDLFQKFRKENRLSFSGFLMALLSMGMMKYAFKGFEWPTKLLAFDCLRDTRMYFKDSYANRTKYVTNYIGATMPVLFLAHAFNEKRFKNKSKRRSTTAGTTAAGQNDATNLTGSSTVQNLTFIADCLTEYSKTQGKIITEIIRKRSASMVTLKSVAYYLQAFADPVKAKRLFSLIKSKDFSEGRTSFAGFSNLGRVDSDPKHVDIQSLIAAIDISRFIYCINYIVVTVKNKVHITTSYPTVLYSDEAMSELNSATQEVIGLVLDRYERTREQSANTSGSGAASSSVTVTKKAASSPAAVDSTSKPTPNMSSEKLQYPFGCSSQSDIDRQNAITTVGGSGVTCNDIEQLPVDDSDDVWFVHDDD